MIAIIARKELVEYWRDGRFVSVFTLTAILVLAALIAGWSTSSIHKRESEVAQGRDRTTFLGQGSKPPHSAAHFGRMAYKAVPPLATFDPGAGPYLGQVIWLEAHRRSPAMFRPAEDAPEIRRIADLSVAGVLTVLVPLLMFMLGHGAFVADRERGTLRQIASTGVSMNQLFAGKLVAVAGVGIGICVASIAAASSGALSIASSTSTWDMLIRALGLCVVYSLYSVTCAAIALLVSARARTAGSALLMLLSAWAIAIVIVPRTAASIAEQVDPIPDSVAFWASAADAIRASRPKRDSPEYRAAAQTVLGRALDRHVSLDEIGNVAVSRAGLALEIGELFDARVYQEAYERLYATYRQHLRTRRLASLVSPVLALQHASSAFSGTDLVAQEHFAVQAERQRNLIMRTLNEDTMLNGALQGDRYVAAERLWKRVPEFSYQPPPASLAIESARGDTGMLVIWCACAILAAWLTARRQRVA